MDSIECDTVDANEIPLSLVFQPANVVSFESHVTRAELLGELVSSLAATGRLNAHDVSDIVTQLIEREWLGTTALGKGLAFPHMRSRAVNESIGAIGFSSTGISFASLDGQPTRLVLLVVSPFDHGEQHRRIMSRLAALMSDNTLQYSLQIPRNPSHLYRFLGFDFV